MHKSNVVRRSFGNTFIAVIASVCILQGCFPAGLRSVSEENKDTSGTYDGRRVAVGKKTASVQTVSGWKITCVNKEDKNYGPINVSDGEVSISIGGNQGKGFIGNTGNFRLEVPLDAEVTASGTSDESITNGAVTLIFTGSLADQTGLLTFGVDDFGNAGCATSVTYDKG